MRRPCTCSVLLIILCAGVCCGRGCQAGTGLGAADDSDAMQPIAICSDGVSLCVGSEHRLLTGLNFFGFETTWGTMVDGIFHGPTALSIDFVNVIRRFKLLGFNAVRLPFSMAALFETPPKDYNTWCPYFLDRYTNPTVDDILRSVTPPNVEVSKEIVNATTVRLAYEPLGTLPPDGTEGECNSYLPSRVNGTDTLDRFIWVMSFLARNDFVVVPVDQLQFDDSIHTDRHTWGNRWSTIMERVAADPWARKRVMFDIMNEPDAQFLHWVPYTNRSGTYVPAIGEVYHTIMKRGHEINPEALYLVEGAGQVGLGLSWGDGFAHARSLLDAGRFISDPSHFFRSLVGPEAPPYANKVIISPHVYPASVIPRGCTNKALCNRLSNSWGYLQLKGFCHEGHCRRFPVLVGELGSRMRDCRNPCANREPECMGLELQTMADLAEFLVTEDFWHAPVAGWLWWAWNPNSADTGGIVEDDWNSLNWEKVNYMTRIGLRPWYSASCPDNFCPVPELDTSPLQGCRNCSEEEVRIDSRETQTPFGRLPWTQRACPDATDHTCCLQPLECEGNCDPDSACAAPVIPSRPPLPPYKLEPLPLPLPDDAAPVPSGSHTPKAASAVIVAVVSAVASFVMIL